MKKIRIFGLDYGRGTMAGFYADTDAKSKEVDPHAFMDERGEPSGFAGMDDASTRVGKTMYNIPSRDYGHIAEWHINVKEMPRGSAKGDALQIRCAKAWREHIMAKNPQLFNDDYEEHWFVGCPTGWRSRKTIEDYGKIFTAAGFKNVTIVPESNAAMMYAEHAYGFVAHVDERIGVLCVDLGAYSADSTYVRPGKSVASYGGYVGASLIEKMVVEMNLQDQFRLSEAPYLSTESLRAVREEYCRNEKFRTLLLNKARLLKEEYYTSIVDGADFNDSDCSTVVALDDEWAKRCGTKRISLYVNDALTKAIVFDRSVKSVLGAEFDSLPEEVRAELGNQSWGGALETFLKKTLEICPDFAAAARDGTDACLLITGGASLMNFVREVVLKVMPNVRLYQDAAPMATIAKGLVMFGPEKLRAQAFDSRFQELMFCDSSGKRVDAGKNNQVLNVLASRAHDTLVYGWTFERKGDFFTDGLTYDMVDECKDMGIVFRTVDKMIQSVSQAASQWGDGDFESGKVAAVALEKFKKWVDSPSGDSMEAVQAKTVEYVKSWLAGELNAAFAPLLKEYELDTTLLTADSLELEYADSHYKWWKSQYESVFKPQIDDENSFYSKLPNPSAGFLAQVNPFGTSRQEVYDDHLELMKARSADWFDKAREFFKTLNDKTEIYGPFLNDCVGALLKAIATAKKTKLGELIVEEAFDDEGDIAATEGK